MRRVVLHISAFLEWFDPKAPGRALRGEYESGVLSIVAPPIFGLQVLESVARQSGWDPDRLQQLAVELDRVGFEIRDAPSAEFAAWLARGLSGPNAAYAALASALELPLITNDPELLRAAATVATSAAKA